MNLIINEKVLEREMRQYIEHRILLRRDVVLKTGRTFDETDKCREAELRNLSGLDLFNKYQNNFWIAVVTAYRYLDDDGAVKPENASSSLIQTAHLSEIHEVVLRLGYKPETIRNIGKQVTSDKKLTEENLQIIKTVFLAMRNLGFSHRDLMG